MDLEKIKNLMDAMEERKITKLVLKEKNGVELELERDGGFQVEPYPHPQVHAPVKEAPPPPEKAPKKKKEAPPPKEGDHITSPMVGTFYSKPSPEDSFFVKVGDHVDEDTVVCIIEAMKVMNEVKAGKKGVIAEVLVDNANPVEFGTKLFRFVEA